MATYGEHKLLFKPCENKTNLSWKKLQVEQEFCDVTLTCDGNQILVHKAVISSWSPILKKVLKQTPDQNLLVHITFTDLQNLVNFMYQDEVRITNANLGRFLVAAMDFQIKGLTKETFSCELLEEQQTFEETSGNSRVVTYNETGPPAMKDILQETTTKIRDIKQHKISSPNSKIGELEEVGKEEFKHSNIQKEKEKDKQWDQFLYMETVHILVKTVIRSTLQIVPFGDIIKWFMRDQIFPVTNVIRNIRFGIV